VIAVQIAKAFELIRSQTGKEDELIDDLMKLPQVKETHLLAGKWDLMATLSFKEQPVDSREHLLDVVTGQIRKMPLVRDTNTIVPAISRMKETHPTRPQRRAYAFVFIKTRMGKEQKVMNRIMRHNEVAESHLLLGKSDVLAVLEFEKGITPPVPERVARIVTEEIAKIENIVGTETLCPIRSVVKE
jgi:DNA-binding Lrp family transcriptional regulator